MLDDDLSRLRRVISNGDPATAIDAALVPIAATRDARAIRPLLLMLNDDVEDDGLWSLVHAAEQFDEATYVESFLRALPDLVVASTRWASILMMRTLNNDDTRAELVRQLRDAPDEVRRTATTLCESINERDVRFLAKTTAVLVAAGR